MTLDYQHALKVKEFMDNDNLKDDIRSEIESLENRINTTVVVKDKKEMEHKVLKCEKKIKKLDADEINYYMTVMDLLIQYYDPNPVGSEIYEKGSIENESEGMICKKNHPPLCKCTCPQASIKPKKRKKNTKSSKESSSSLSSFVTTEKTNGKADILDRYMYRLYNRAPSRPFTELFEDDHCNDCDIPKVLDSTKSIYVCRNCGRSTRCFVQSEMPPFTNNASSDGNNFSYRRYDHFVEWINKFQNSRKNKIPDQLYEDVRKELDRTKCDSFTVNKPTISRILKKTGHSKYNSQAQHVMNTINNTPTPKLPQFVVDKMKIMFKRIQRPFEICCPIGRTNFLSYAYIIRKFLELLNQPKYVEYFPLLKSREKLYFQDLLWKSMCLHLKWKYNASL